MALKASFPQWAERQRSNIRATKAIGSSIEHLNLQYLMADLLEEQRDKSSLVAKSLAYRARNNPNKLKDSPKDKTNPKANSNKNKDKSKENSSKS